jgi:hypothetical protein
VPTRFVFQPARFRDEKVVPTDDPPLIIEDIKALVAKFAPERKQQLVQLRGFRPSAIVGWARGSRTGTAVPFLLWNIDRTNRFGWLLKKDPLFPERVIECYRVEEMDWGSTVIEVESGKKDQPGWNQPAPRVGTVLKETSPRQMQRGGRPG